MKKNALFLLLIISTILSHASNVVAVNSTCKQVKDSNTEDKNYNFQNFEKFSKQADSSCQVKILKLFRAKSKEYWNDKNFTMWAKCNFASAHILTLLGKKDSALQLCLNCAESFRKVQKVDLEAQCYNYIVRNSLGSESETLKYICTAFSLYDELKDSSHIISLYSELARACRRSGNIKKAAYYSLKMVGPTCNDSLYALSLAGYYYLHLDDSLKGEELLKLASKKFNCASDTMNFYFYRALAYYFKLKGQLDSSDYYAKKVIQPLLINGIYKADPEPILILAENCKTRGQVNKQKEWIDLAYSSTNDNAPPYFLQQIYKAKCLFEEQVGNDRKAYKFYKLYIFWTDSINRMGILDEIGMREAQDEFRQRKATYESISNQKISQEKNIAIAATSFLLIVLVFAVFQFQSYKKQKTTNRNLAIEKKRSEDLLLNILPEAVAEELKAKGSADAKQFDHVTVLFTDFKSFTALSENLNPQKLVNELNVCFKAFDEIISKYNIEKIKTMGDGFIAAAGLPYANPNHATVLCA